MTTQIKEEDRFLPYEMIVKYYRKSKDPETLALLLELQQIYNNAPDLFEVDRIDEEGIPHYKVKRNNAPSKSVV